MKRREFITLLGGAAVAGPLAARAQQRTIPVIGFLDVRSVGELGVRLRAFREGLKETGFVEDDNISVLYRFAENQSDRLGGLAGDLVQRNVAVIATGGPPAAFAAKAATKMIPILFIVAQDPARLGLVASLARPGSNLTGVNIFNGEVIAKRLDLLRSLIPKATRIAVLVDPSDVTNTKLTVQGVEAVAAGMGLQITIFNANDSSEINAAFESIEAVQADALFVATSPFLNGRRVQVAQLAAFHRLPATYPLRECVEAGGLMSYGTDISDAYRQVGVYAGRIIKGAKAADLPVVQASKFELVINAQTARMLSLTVPSSLLAVADEVIE